MMLRPSKLRLWLLVRLRRLTIRLSGPVQLVGLAAVVGGIAIIYPPAALIIGGLGVALWAQGVSK